MLKTILDKFIREIVVISWIYYYVESVTGNY